MYLLILIWMITLALDSLPPVSCNYSDETVVITIHDTGNNTLQCCAYGKCYCSNLSLVLEHIVNNTEIKIMSSISLHGVPQFECTNDAKVTIIGYNNPVVKCNHQGGLVGRNVGHIVIHGVTWNGCDQGIEIDGFLNVNIIQCNFLSLNSALTLRGHGMACINNSVFNNTGNRGVYLDTDSNYISTVVPYYVTIYNSTFYNATLTVVAVDYFYANVSYITIKECSFSDNTYYSLHCKGTDYLMPKISIFLSTFTYNQVSAVKAEYCNIIVQNNCSFFNNYKCAIDISYSTINMTGPLLFYNNNKHSTIHSYGGAISLLSSNMSVNKGLIKFHNNVAGYGGAIYVCKYCSVHVNSTDLEFYNNSARFYGGVFYIESSLCKNKVCILYYYNMLYNAGVHYADSNTATLSGNFVYFYVYDALHCDVPNYYNISYKNNKMFATQPYSIVGLYETKVFGNFINERNTFIFWLHDLHFNLTITDCFNNLHGPAQVFICCDSCNERYEYIVDSSLNNVTMISDDTVVSCSINEEDTIKLVAVANDFNSNGILVFTEMDVKIISSNGLVGNCSNIGHVLVFNYTLQIFQCLPLLCNLSSQGYLPKGIDCFEDNYFIIVPGYWFSNGFVHHTNQCPQSHCSNTFHLFNEIFFHSNGIYPTSDDQCASHWTGLACGECGEDNFIIHDSTSCVPSSNCFLKQPYSLIIFFLVSLLYWIVVISLIFVLLNFKFNITAGYAYGILFYYSVLEQTVNASYIGTQNQLNDPYITTSLSILSIIGNMKPPLQLLKLCFGKFKMIDHMFLTYFHPIIVTCLIVAIFISARNFVTVARTVGRYVNSKSICILLMLSYSSVSYTSLQIFRPLAIEYNDNDYYPYWYNTEWHSYLSATERYFHGRHMIYCIIAIVCEVAIGVGFPCILLIQPYLTRYLNINFTTIKPVIDQLKGCYKEEYQWFAAYYLICRQVIYVLDIGTDFLSSIKFPIMLSFYTLIMMVHVWLQPYKQRKLNMLDSSILVTLILVYIGEHISYGTTLVLWILPLVLFINCITFSSRWKYLMIPLSCSVIIAVSCLDAWALISSSEFVLGQEDITFYSINLIIALITVIIFLAYLIYVSKWLICLIVIKRRQRPEYRLINTQTADDSNEDSDSSTNDVP